MEREPLKIHMGPTSLQGLVVRNCSKKVHGILVDQSAQQQVETEGEFVWCVRRLLLTVFMAT